ncbi:hypothetical protein SAMN05443429_10238 [Cruoricaptor ignavus]|uniref:Uncharacterized protein n=1 Tax=Cruoricaptor ignavus TaxID=1118202 RepID=A0A1M6BKE9_9FLAO|nr:hypothetical protein SAMN05443429_10238 [Cruoricaptor ignavus]
MNFSFKLKEPNSDHETLIYFRSFFDHEKKSFIYSTRREDSPQGVGF